MSPHRLMTGGMVLASARVGLPISRTLAAVGLMTAIGLMAGGWPTAIAAQPPKRVTVAELVSLTAPPPDHRIGYGDGPLQFGNLRLPRRPGRHPVVVFVHGGCWLSQFSIGHVGPLEQALADSGYAVWSLEYRRVGDDGGGWPGTFQDIGRGADHLRVLAKQYPLDLDRVIAAGHSAGGQFALWLAGRDQIDRSSPLWVERPLPVRGVLALAPAPDLEGLHQAAVCDRVIDRLMGGSPADHADRYRAASPMRFSPLAVPQRLVVGTFDEAWGPIGRRYYARAVERGDAQVELIEATESGHFDMIVPSTSSWSVVLGALRSLLPAAR